jgi:hypothetical protein
MKWALCVGSVAAGDSRSQPRASAVRLSAWYPPLAVWIGNWYR